MRGLALVIAGMAGPAVAAPSVKIHSAAIAPPDAGGDPYATGLMVTAQAGGALLTVVTSRPCDAIDAYRVQLHGSQVRVRIEDTNRSPRRASCALLPAPLTLDLEGLAPGRYELEVEVGGGGNDFKAKLTVPAAKP